MASSSPRRTELLTQIKLPFSVVKSTYSEQPKPSLLPAEVAMHHALGKAKGALPLPAPGICIGADTIVVLGKEIMEKPQSRDHAIQMITRLSGVEHEVITGLALIDHHGNSIVSHESTKVQFCSLTEAEILTYVESGEPMDKAGAYAIQGRAAVFIPRILGCYSNVVGLPLALLAKMALQQWGLRLAEEAGR